MNKKLLILGLVPALLVTGCNNPGTTSDKKITLNKETLSLAIDDTFQVTYTLQGFEDGADELLTWTSSNEAVATVNDGLIYALSEGSATISASLESYTASLSLNVYSTGEVASFSILEEQEVYPGTILSFNETTAYKGQLVDAQYTYTSSDTSVVSVNNGVVKAEKEGSATVTVTSKYLGFENSATCLVNVIPNIEIVLNYETATLATKAYRGTSYIKEIQLSAQAYVDNEKVSNSISWSTSDANIATVSTNGLVTSGNEGVAEIYASISHNNKTYKKAATINVKTPTIQIEETVVVNMLKENKTLDLYQLGINVAKIEKIQMFENDSWTNVDYTVDGETIYITVSDSLYNQTREMRVDIEGEYTLFNVAFKDYVKDKIFFADSEKHLSDLEALGNVTISYDATRSITSTDVANAEKEVFENEEKGTVKIQMTGNNVDEVKLVNPITNNVSQYDYLVFYVYSNYDGYFACLRNTDAYEVKANQWNRIVVNNFDDVLKVNGKSITEDKYDPTGLVFKFYNNRQPSKKATLWLSSMYGGVSPTNRVLSMEVGATPTFWWVNGVVIENSGYQDYYGHFTNEKAINLEDILPEDRQYFKHEANGTMVIRHDGEHNIEAHYFNAHPLNGYTDLLFYVYTDAPRASEMSVYARNNVDLGVKLQTGKWTRVHMDLKGKQILGNDGTLHTDVDNLHGWFIGIGSGSKSPYDTKFYITSVYGFNW